MVNHKYLVFVFLLLAFLGGCTHQGISTSRRFSPAVLAARPVNTPNVWPDSAPIIYARYAILIDAQSGKTLFQKNADIRTPVASTQKLLIALLTTKRGNLDDLISIQSEDTRVEPMKLNLRAGDRYSRRTLLNATLVASMNDAAEALGRDVAGSTAAAGTAMTHLARSFGAHDSRFLNASGLPALQYSTARDMARVAWHAYHDRAIRQITCQRGYVFQYANGNSRYLKATNLLLGKALIYNGLKTGDTKASGRCLITSAIWNGHAFILVQLGSKTRYIFDDAERMMAWAFNRSRSL